MKTLIILCLLSCSVQTVAQTSDKKPQIKPGTLQGNGGPGITPKLPSPGDGNGGPGGGNALKEYPGSPDQVFQYVEKDLDFKLIVKAILKKLQYRMTIDKKPFGGAQKGFDILFSRNRKHQTVYQVVDMLNFSVLPQGECIDLDGHEKDATAFNKTPNTVCLSAEGIAKSATYTSLPIKLYALVIHEVSHYMDIPDEKPGSLEKSDAELIQQQIELEVRAYVQSMFREEIKWLNTFPDDGIAKIDAILKEIADGKIDTEICAGLGFLYAQFIAFGQTLEMFEAEGALALPVRQTALIAVGFDSEVVFSEGMFCFDQAKVPPKDMPAVDEKGYVSVNKGITPEIYQTLLDPLKVKFIPTGGREQLKENLEALKIQLRKIQASVPKSQMPTPK